MNQRPIPNPRLTKAREDAGFKTVAAFAKKFGLTESLVRSNENGHRPLTNGQAKIYAKHLGVSWLYLIGESENPHEINAQMSPTDSVRKRLFQRSNANVTNESPDRLRVLGMAEGGPDGWNLFNGDEVVQTIGRPHNLLGVVGAYAVFLRGDSMLPVYQPGWTIHVHPGKPVEPGCYVLVQRRNPQDRDHPFAVIKRLVRRTQDKLILAQLNPPKQITIPTSQVVSVHRIVGSSEA